MNPERLQKVLASAGIASRRDSEDFITSGRVAVNGKVVRVAGTRVDPETDTITIDGQPLGPIQPRTYIMLNKPVGVVSTTDDPQGRQTVVDLVESEARLFPVGRLDYDSEGLIILTDDGALTQQLTHPSNQVEKEYRVLLNEAPSSDALREWRNGLLLDGVMTSPAWVEIVERSDEGSWVRVVLREGRKRQIREVAKLLGYDVLRLIRVREGPLQLGELAQGESRALTEAEVEQLWEHAEKTARETQAATRERPSGPRRSDAGPQAAPRPANPGRQCDEHAPARDRQGWRDDQYMPNDQEVSEDNWGNHRDYQPRDDRNRGTSRSAPGRGYRGSPRDYPRRDDRGGSGPRDFQRRDPRSGSGPRDFQRRDDRGSSGGSGPRDFQRRDPRSGSGPRDFQRRDDRGGSPRDYPPRRDDRGSSGGSGPRDFQRRDDRGGSPRDYPPRRDDRGSSGGSGPRDFQRRDNRGDSSRDYPPRRDDRGSSGGSGPRDFQRRDNQGGSPRDYPPRRDDRGDRGGSGPRDYPPRRDDRGNQGGSRDSQRRDFSSERGDRPRQDNRHQQRDDARAAPSERPDFNQEASPRSSRPRLTMRIRRPKSDENEE